MKWLMKMLRSAGKSGNSGELNLIGIKKSMTWINRRVKPEKEFSSLMI
jgi:hypothetical protein